MKNEITAILVGAGHRAREAAIEGLKYSKNFKVVGVVDPDEHVLKICRELCGVPKDHCYKHINEVLKQGKIADCIINGTMDHLHIETSLPFLEQGYDMLLEKPITSDSKELLMLQQTVKKYKI